MLLIFSSKSSRPVSGMSAEGRKEQSLMAWEEEERGRGKSRGERLVSRTRGQNSFRFASEQIVWNRTPGLSSWINCMCCHCGKATRENSNFLKRQVLIFPNPWKTTFCITLNGKLTSETTFDQWKVFFAKSLHSNGTISQFRILNVLIYQCCFQSV